jgi:hypothetical protein
VDRTVSRAYGEQVPTPIFKPTHLLPPGIDELQGAPASAVVGPRLGKAPQAARLAAMAPNPRFYERNFNAPGLNPQGRDHPRADAERRVAGVKDPAHAALRSFPPDNERL